MNLNTRLNSLLLIGFGICMVPVFCSPSFAFDPAHLAGSSQAGDGSISFSAGVRPQLGDLSQRKKDYVDAVMNNFEVHLSTCAFDPRRKSTDLTTNRPKRMGGEEIDPPCISFFEMGHRHVLRPHYPASKALNDKDISDRVAKIFNSFYDGIDEWLFQNPERNYLQTQDAAFTWLWRTLTQHTTSLPVIGWTDPDVPADLYRWGDNQLALIKYIGRLKNKPPPMDVGAVQAQNYIANYLARGA